MKKNTLFVVVFLNTRLDEAAAFNDKDGIVGEVHLCQALQIRATPEIVKFSTMQPSPLSERLNSHWTFEFPGWTNARGNLSASL